MTGRNGFRKDDGSVYLDVTQCIGCGGCLMVCPAEALHRMPDGTMRIDTVRCRQCGVCADACPTGAMTRDGERKEVPQ